MDSGSAVVTTDDGGNYSISGVRSAPAEGMSPLLSASKSGYFTAIEFANRSYSPIQKDTQLDLKLSPLAAIPVGDTIHARDVPLAEVACSHWGYGTGDCRRFAVTVSSSGTLDITLSAPVFNHDVDIVGPDGTFVLYDPSWRVPLRLAIQVTAGSTYEIRVMGALADEFDLTTALRADGG